MKEMKGIAASLALFLIAAFGAFNVELLFQDFFSQFMSQMVNQMSNNQSSNQAPPEERFASQLDQLASMGFVDRQANIQGE